MSKVNSVVQSVIDDLRKAGKTAEADAIVAQIETAPEPREALAAGIKDGKIVVAFPLHDDPQPSKSGKSTIIAASDGTHRTTATWNGMPVVLTASIYAEHPKAQG
jgi:hypothetical protein